MKSFVKKALVAIFVGVLSSSLFAQEKTQSYYNTHETEILPDARAAFQRGNYDRAVELCKWHYIIVGNHDAESLRNMAERCTRLSTEILNQQSAGRMKEAEEAANTLLSINPNDPVAKKLIEELSQPATPLPLDTLEVTITPDEEERVVEKTIQEPEQKHVDSVIKEEPARETQDNKITQGVSKKQRTKFVLKGGISIIDSDSSGAAGGSLGVYDIGGSPFGLEFGGYYCPRLYYSTGSMFGIDASISLRIVRFVYPKFGVGLFSFMDKDIVDTPTMGLCGVGGLTFLLANRFCLEVGARYYPAVFIQGSETVSTTPGLTYEFPIKKQVSTGGIAPFVSIGWAF